ncbi:MAG: GTP-binding protein, partial [Oscillospiraceae bacterium]|nr:GTP-binding protein [Oscillospiraceae bacterium]
MSYTTDKIRNVILIGHGSSGKTSLAESMLYITGAIDRQGKVADGNTVCDYDPEEIKRKISISTSVAPVIYDNHKINIIDTPGFFDFAGDVMTALAAADFAVVVVTAKDGITVGTERAFKRLRGAKVPFMFYISKIDEENTNCNKIIYQIRERFGNKICAVTIPSSDGKGVVDIVHQKGFMWNGKAVEEFALNEADTATAA